MTNVQNQMIALSYSAIFAHAGVDLHYARGNDSVDLVGAMGKSGYELEDAAGLVTDVEIRDFLVRASELQLHGTPVVPQAGDLITADPMETGLSPATTYIVASPSNREPCWRWSDPARTIRRIHVKLVQEGGDA